ncbi:gamma-glutamyltransferase family protein [Salinarimonas rosea]|uniref:gamma-glutamyltransferase family protein n=1 Tax=Salinarimonas rosea TaxID=552063 RepID=UPI00041D7FBB|nr:gamma-glutamyltransferase family protein [Salinarimonas rosea]
MLRDFQAPGRSAVFGTNAMIATSHPLASLVGVETMKRGGSAADAALAASAMLCVVEPHMTGIGGDCFALVAAPGAPTRALMGSGPSPRGIDRAAVADTGLSAIPDDSPHAVNVPGAVAAWVALHAAHGRLPLAELMEPAARVAEAGYAIAPRVARDWAVNAPRLARRAETASAFLKDGRPLAPGDVHRQPALAATLRAIGRDGRAGFYEGAVADDMIATLRGLGGTHAHADLAGVEATWVAPIRGRFAGIDVVETPPNGQGATALLILKALESWDVWRAARGPERLRLYAEATRAAYRLRDGAITDPAAMKVDLETFLGEEAVAFVRRAAADPGPGPGSERGTRDLGPIPWDTTPCETDTICLSVVDPDGLVVSFINSLFHPFGSTLYAPRSGVLFHCRGASFSLDAGHPNALAPGKHTMHTIIPGLVEADGAPLMPFGVMGGQYQAAGHAHLMIRLFEERLDLQSAIDAPRLFGYGGRTEVETGFDDETRARLAERGAAPETASAPIGGAQAVLIDRARGVLVGASDPRKDGCALGW